MDLSGTVTQRGRAYVLLHRSLKYVNYWIILNPYHKEDVEAYFNKEPLLHPLLDIYNVGKMKDITGYISGALKISSVKNEVEGYGDPTTLTGILSSIQYYRSYAFNKNNILVNTTNRRDFRKPNKSLNKMYLTDENGVDQVEDAEEDTANDFELSKLFSASQDGITVSYETVGNRYKYLKIDSLDFIIELKENKFKLPKLEFSPVSTVPEVRRLKGITLPVIDYPMLKMAMGGMEWYEDSWGNILKDYKVISNISEFEEDLMRPMLYEYERCMRTGEEFIMAMDTETDGVNICSLPNDSPFKNKITTMQLSWKDDQGVLIFLDMEYFTNVPVDYMLQRLKPFFILPREETRFFDCTIMEDDGTQRTIKVDRLKINLTGHNTLFDGCVLYDIGCHVYFNNDTMQIAFNINPDLSRGNKGLKDLTMKLFGIHQPSLVDVLGKGNEDKFRYLMDKVVAKIYGCGDTDFTRMVYKALIKFMPADMRDNYRVQDMPLIYGLIPAQYNGMRMDVEAVRLEGMLCKQNMDTLEELIYSYTGAALSVTEQINNLQTLVASGIINETELQQELQNIKPEKGAKYIFKISGKDAPVVIYDKLGYPKVKISETSGKPSVDKQAMARLMRFKKTEEQISSSLLNLPKDIPDALDPNNALVSAKEFNSYKYPLAYLISLYAAWRKEYTSYYAPILRDGMNGRLYKPFNMTNIETRRIACASQTMKANLKKLVLSHADDYCLWDWDKSQVEYRAMVSLAHYDKMINTMKDAEKDFHTETCALVNSIPAHKVSKSARKKVKPISFGIPYGVGVRKTCETIFKEVTEDNLYETRKLVHRFKTANKPVIDYLEHVRDEALIPREFPPGFKTFIGLSEDAALGYVKNELGFWRLFPLDNIGDKEIASIRRKAGNYPIQSFAAEMFRRDLINFLMRTIEEGLQDKIVWHMLIHDELLFSVHKSVQPDKLLEILCDECMTPVEGHTSYYIGINIGDNWAECKDDRSELPILHAMERAKMWKRGEIPKVDWTSNPKEEVLAGKMDYVIRRVKQVVTDFQPESAQPDVPINLGLFMNECENYTVRSYINELFKPNLPAGTPKPKDFDDLYESCFESFILAAYGEGKQYVNRHNQLVSVYDKNSKVEEVDMFGSIGNFDDLAENLDDMEDFEVSKGIQEYWTFDTVGDSEQASAYFIDDYYSDYDASVEEEDPLVRAGYDPDVLAKTGDVNKAVITDGDLQYIRKFPAAVMVKLDKLSQINVFKEVIKNHLVTGEAPGVKILVSVGTEQVEYKRRLKANADLQLIDMELIGALGAKNLPNTKLEIKSSPVHCKKMGNSILVKTPNRKVTLQIKKFLEPYISTTGMKVIFTSPIGRENWVPVSEALDLGELDNFIGKLV